MSLSDFASLSISSTPPTAPVRLSRSLVQLDLLFWPVAYFEAVQGLDDEVEGLSEGVRRELVIAAGQAAGGAGVWDLAVIHYQEANDLPLPTSGPLSSGPLQTPKEVLAELLTTSLQNLQRLSQQPRLLQKLGERKMVFLQEAFPGLGESSDEDESGSDEEWESDDGDGEEEDEDEDDEQPAEDDEMTTT